MRGPSCFNRIKFGAMIGFAMGMWNIHGPAPEAWSPREGSSVSAGQSYTPEWGGGGGGLLSIGSAIRYIKCVEVA